MRYRIEYYPNPNRLTIHVDTTLTGLAIERFENIDHLKRHYPPLVQALFNTVPGITEITFERYELHLIIRQNNSLQNHVHLTKGEVFFWEEIVRKALPVLLEFFDPQGTLDETAPPKEPHF